MRQLQLDPQTGDVTVQEVPRPPNIRGGVIVATAASVISPGTERHTMQLAEKSLVGKALARPDLVRKVIRKAKQEGWLNAWQAARTRLDSPSPVGYSAAGIVEEVGEEVQEIRAGDRVAIAGAGYANHAEVNAVPRNLVARVPDRVSLEQAAYTTIGAIALQGIRLAEPEVGGRFAVVGLGLVGLITVQLLRASGCRVLGFDLDAGRVALGEKLGLEEGIVPGSGETEEVVNRFSRGVGVDGTIITAATESSEPIRMAGRITRSKGRVVVVGDVGMEIPRRSYFEKELSLVVSRSYGPGRYDPSYEEGGIDYPVDYVRWTEQRNMQAVLDLMADGKLDMDALTTHRFSFPRAVEAYKLIRDDDGGEPHLGVVLEYDRDGEALAVIRLSPEAPAEALDSLGVGFVGAGNYATTHLLPHLEDRPDVRLRGLVSGSGISARQKADRFGFSYCASEIDDLLEDETVDALFIATRHALHADLVLRGLRAGKHVFVEKPLAVTENQLDEIVTAYREANGRRPTGLMVGLNRRFSPLVSELRDHFGSTPVNQMIYRVNSGHIPTSSWLHRPEEGGGMLVGEMCHFVDLMIYLVGDVPAEVVARSARVEREDVADRDNVAITLSFEGGATGVLCYNTVGSRAEGKERLEVYGGGRLAWLDDFRELVTVRGERSDHKRKWSQDKGRAGQISETVESFRTRGQGPIPFNELEVGMRTIFAACRSLGDGSPAPVQRRKARDNR